LPRYGCDVDELLGRRGEVAMPELVSGRGVERKRIRVGRAVDMPIRDGEAVRSVVPREEDLRPAQLAGVAIDSENVAAEILDEDRLAGNDRRRGEDACEARLGRQAE